MQSLDISHEAREWAAKNFAEPLGPVASVIGHLLSTSEIWSKPLSLSRVVPDSHFVDDLEIDPLFDLIEFVIDVEAAFGFEIPDDVLKTIGTVGEMVLAVHRLLGSPGHANGC